MDPLQEAFTLEANEILETLETSLLALDGDPDRRGEIDAAFRALHTLKGSGAMVGFAELERFAHSFESAFDAVRASTRSLDPELLNASLAALDHLGILIGAGPSPGPELIAQSNALLRRLAAPRPTATDIPEASSFETPAISSAWLVTVAPEPSTLVDGLDPLAVFEELSSLCTWRAFGIGDASPPLESWTPGHLHLMWSILIVSDASLAQLEDVFFFLQDRAVLQIEAIADHVRPDAIEVLGPELDRGLGEDIERLKAILPRVAPSPSLRPASPVPERAPQAPAPPTGGTTWAREDMIKVAATKLDVLVDLVGEMVIAQARLAEAARRHADPELLAVAEDLERMCVEMRESTMDLRMVPIGTTLSRFRRLVRDVAQQLGKRIQLEISGEETELDKTVIDKLGDPLIHLIRNSLDHGIESPEERQAAGKPAEGRICLSARHSDTNVVLEVRDDGKGLDTERIRAKAIERGLIAAEAHLSPTETQNLIFEPGFSTAQNVSSLSGRGVGMDAVRSAVRALRGDVILTSERGVGTTLSIQLPLTLAIIEGLLVGLGRSRYILPLSQVEECIEVPLDGSQFAELRGELVPFIDLARWFEVPGAGSDHQQIIVTNVDGQRYGFIVDDVVGQQQTVIKSLGRAYRGVDGISGATILGNGEVALILDPKKIAGAVRAAPPRMRNQGCCRA